MTPTEQDYLEPGDYVLCFDDSDPGSWWMLMRVQAHNRGADTPYTQLFGWDATLPDDRSPQRWTLPAGVSYQFFVISEELANAAVMLLHADIEREELCHPGYYEQEIAEPVTYRHNLRRWCEQLTGVRSCSA